MKKRSRLNIIPAVIAAIFSFALIFVACNSNASKEKKPEENLTSGTAVMYVDNSVGPVVDDVLAVFHSRYPQVNIKQRNLPEADIIKLLLADSARIAILTRKLTPAEESNFNKRKVTAKINEFAKDAIALTGIKGGDTIVKLDEVLKLLQGKPSEIKSLVFDSPESGAVKFLMGKAGITSLPKENVYALRSNAEVLKYVSQSKGAIGVIGLNLLLQPTRDVAPLVEKVEILAVSNVKKESGAEKYYKPNQSNIAAGSYPLTRTLYVLNYQGKLGLGMGFANYVTSPDGQRIILKSGLLPVTMPTREIEVRNEL